MRTSENTKSEAGEKTTHLRSHLLHPREVVRPEVHHRKILAVEEGQRSYTRKNDVLRGVDRDSSKPTGEEDARRLEARLSSGTPKTDLCECVGSASVLSILRRIG